MTRTPEPKGKLDATACVVNGPEDEAWTGTPVDWRPGRGARTAAAAADLHGVAGGDLARVRNLQKLMLRSRANALVSVRRVTERNAGRRTAGVDGEVVLTARGKAELAVWVQHGASRRGGPGRSGGCTSRKANGKQRPLGIPVIARPGASGPGRHALEPEWEARFEPRSYGFRPGRGCQDAIAAIYITRQAARRPSGVWALDADLAAAFDRIDHDHISRHARHVPRPGTWSRRG